jgi:uncharacterized protein (DUF433 family)
MTRVGLLQHVIVDPQVCAGKACVKGTRIWVSLVMENLAAGLSGEAIIKEYPQLTLDDISACLTYAAELARERVIPVPIPSAA